MRDQPAGIGFNTLAIHAGDRRGAGPHERSIIDGIGTAQRFDAFDLLSSRASDATSFRLEERIAALDGGSAAVAVASGSLARTLALKTLLRPGDELVASRRGDDIDHDFDEHFKSCGWLVKWVGSETDDSFIEAVSDKTRAILVESVRPADGYLVDIDLAARAAQRARVPLLVDNSLGTPYLMRPLEHGADIVLYSAERLAGQDDLVGGLIVDGGTFEWADDARYPAMTGPNRTRGGSSISETFGNFAFAVACRLTGQEDLGAALAPSDSAAILHGIETLPLRMRRHSDNALAIAQLLERHPAISSVQYAGLTGDRSHDVAQRFWANGVGAICLFEVAGGVAAATAFMSRLKLFSKSAAVGVSRSTIAMAAPTAVGANWLRMSVGIEDVDDLIADLSQALAS